jgi:O-antigen/teichoic acid export membrane protein
LGIYANRYCLTLFLPLAVFLAVYGRPLLVRWVGEAFAAHSAPLLPVFLAGYTLVQAAQYNSGSILFGLNKHGGYARGLAVEAVLYVSGLVWVVPRYGILGAACVAGVCMTVTRGVYTPWLVCRALDYPFLAYMRGIYVRPLATAVPVAALAWLLKARGVAGNTWVELIMAGCVCGLVYSALAFYTCVEPDHRRLLLRRIPVLGPRFRDDRV